MNNVKLVDTETGNERHFDSRAEAEEQRGQLPGEYKIVVGNEEEQENTDTAEDIDERTPDDVDVVDMTEDGKADTHTRATHPEEYDTEELAETHQETGERAEGGVPDGEGYDLPDNPPVDTDPLDWIPNEFQDTVDGTVAINRKGFEVLAHYYGISCQTDMVVYPVETDGEYVVHKATAVKDDGTEYTAYGEAYRDEEGDTMVRMSDTRAYKRAVSRATGTGMIAVEELKSEL